MPLPPEPPAAEPLKPLEVLAELQHHYEDVDITGVCGLLLKMFVLSAHCSVFYPLWLTSNFCLSCRMFTRLPP